MEQVEQFCLDVKHGMSKWQNLMTKQTEEEKNTIIIPQIVLDMKKKKEFQSWIENQDYTQVIGQDQPNISTR